MISGQGKYFTAAIASAAMWGFFSIPLRNLREYGSEQILDFRIFVSLIITWLIILLLRRKKLETDLHQFKSFSSPERKKLILLTMLAGLLITGNWYAFIYAVNHVSLRSAAFAYMVCPLITAVGGFLILKEHLSTVKFAGIGIAIVSICILAKGAMVDVIWSVFIAALYAFYLIVQRAITQVDKFNMLGIQLIISAFIMLPFFLYHSGSLPLALSFWKNIFLISLVFTIIPLFLSLYALVGIPSSTLGILIYINPMVSFTVAFFYFHEVINTFQLIAYLMLLFAIVVFNWETLRHLMLRRAKIFR